MKFKSIRQKLISQVSLIFVVSSLVVLAVIGYLNTNTSNSNLADTEENIRQGLTAKGLTLVTNNSLAMKGMAEDNAFSQVQELVSNTVQSDSDIVYGIFMDIDLMPWVVSNTENPSGQVAGGGELEDDTSLWAAELEEVSYTTIDYNGDEVYEFAAPVISEDEILGFIRYGITTQTMKKSLAVEAEEAKVNLYKTIGVLVGVILLSLVMGVMFTRRIAVNITTPLNQLQLSAETIAGGDYSKEVGVETNDEVGLLGSIFDKMRTMIQKKMSDLAKLNSTGEVLASLTDQTKALEEALEALHEQTGVSGGSVFLLNQNDDLEVKAFFPPKAIDPDSRPLIFHKGEGIMGKAATQQEILFVPDTTKDPHFVSGKGDESAKSLLCIPLLDKNKLIGVMNCIGDLGTVHFEDSDKEFASSVARLLVITIKNIRMREVIEEQNRTLEQKVEARTAELAQKTNDIAEMMANMHQGLFTITSNGIVHPEYSAYLETILETDRIADRNYKDLLFANSDLGSNSLDQIETAMSAILGEDEMMFDFNSHLLASEHSIQLQDGRSKILEMDWDPIVLDGTVEKVMVTVRDVTELKALQKAAEAQKQELEIIGHILSVTPDKFNDFISTSMDFISQCREIINSTTNKDTEVLATLFRNMHTVKGNARTYGFSYLTNSVHEVENTYDEMRKNEEVPWDQQLLLDELAIAESDVQRYANIAEEKLGRNSEQSEISVGIDKEKIDALLADIAALDFAVIPNDARHCMQETYKTLLSLDAKTIGQVITGVIDSVNSLADELEKPQPKVSIDDGDVFILSHTHSMLNNIFMHVFRNAMDHGIEGVEERQQKGKSSAGEIRLQASIEGEQCVFEVFDDGRGMAIDKIFSKAVEKGLYSQDARPDAATIANLVFSSGFSTAETVTEVSGRGVGMDAVKRFLEQEGGSLGIELTEGNETDSFRPFKTIIKLPTKFTAALPDGLAA